MNQKEREETKKADNMHLQSLTNFGYLTSVKVTSKVLSGQPRVCGSTDTCWLNVVILCHCMPKCFRVLPACEGSCQHHRSVWYFESEKGSMIYSSISVEKPWLVFSSTSAWVACDNQIHVSSNLCSSVSYYMQYLSNCWTSMFWLAEAAAGIMTHKETENYLGNCLG